MRLTHHEARLATAPLEKQPEPVRFTVDRHLGLAQEGLLSRDDRVELLQGVVVAMTPRSPSHASVVSRVSMLLSRAIPEGFTVRPPCPLVVPDHSAPEPDIAVVAGPASEHERRHPTTALLVIEVSDVSLQQDRLTKSSIYAAAGIPEYWIVDLRRGSLEVRREPAAASCRYERVAILRPGDRVLPVAFRAVAFAVSHLLPETEPEA